MTARRGLAALALWLAGVLGLWASEAKPAVIVLAGLVGGVAAVAGAATDLARTVAPIEWLPPRPAPEATPADERWALTLRHQLDSGRRRHSTELRDTLAALVQDLVDDRRRADPAAVVALTPGLQRLLDEPDRPVGSARELRRLLDDLEAL